MTYSFQKHPLSDADLLWLQEIAGAERFDARIAKVNLLEKIPIDYDPSQIDSRIVSGGEITSIGMWHLDANHQMLSMILSVILSIRQLIVEKPGIERIEAGVISKIANLDQQSVSLAMYQIGKLGHFFSSASGASDSNSYTIFSLSDENAYDEYLRFRNIHELLESWYVTRGGHYEGPTLIPWKGFEGSLDVFGQNKIHIDVDRRVIRPNTAFVLVAIDPSKPENEDVYKSIKEICLNYSIEARRADEIEHQDRITDVILNEISTCHYLIADFTYERPNVYYEIGYAHALQKNPILYRRKGTKLHFDLSVHNVPEYRNITHLKEILTKRLSVILGREV